MYVLTFRYVRFIVSVLPQRLGRPRSSVLDCRFSRFSGWGHVSETGIYCAPVVQFGYFTLAVIYIHDMASFDLMEALSVSASVSFNFDDLYRRVNL